MTLGYFPQVYPNELFYSVLARYHLHIGARSAIQSMEALFGRRLVVASVDLPGHLNALVERMDFDCHLTADDIIDDMTLLPYYVAFQPQALRDEARNAMKLGQTDGLMMKLGMTAFCPKRVTKLRFCGTCLSQMRDEYGEAYWRRDHQLPGVLVCPDHACVLQESHVSLTEHSRHVFVPPTTKACPWNAKALLRDISSTQILTLQRLALTSRKLLESPGLAKSHPEWTIYYRECMQIAGLTYSTHRMDQRRLKEEFCRFHSKILNLVPFVGLVDDNSGNWLAQIVRKHRKAFHPLYHLLVQDLFDHFGTRELRFGAGPWLCQNPLSGHHGLPTIKVVKQHRNKGHWVGVFECECGYVYTRCYDSTIGKLGKPRFYAYGELLEPEIRKLVEGAYSLREISRRLQLDPKTVVRLAVILGVSTGWTVRSESGLNSKVNNVPSANKSAGIMRTERTKKQRQPRVDWESLDNSLCVLIKNTVELIIRQSPPVRVTTLQIERAIYGRGWITKRAMKLPKAMSSIKTVIESVCTFQQRRVSWVIQEMISENETLKRWRIMRRAGLTMQNAWMVDKALNNHFEGNRSVA